MSEITREEFEATILAILNRVGKIEVWIHNMCEISKAREFPGYEPNIYVTGEENEHSINGTK